MPEVNTLSGSNNIVVDGLITLQYRPEPTGSLRAAPCKIAGIVENLKICWQGCSSGLPTWICVMEKVHEVTTIWSEEFWAMCHKLSAMSQRSNGWYEGV